MDNYELENVNTEIETTESGVDGGRNCLKVIVGVTTLLFAICFAVKYKKKIKELQEKDLNFQKILRENQAKIDALNDEKKRQEYLICLYEKYISNMKE